MNIALKEDKFHIRAFFAACSCSCRFCCLGDYSKDKRVTFEDYEKVMKKFSCVVDRYGMRLRSFVYNCPEHPYVKKQIQLYDSLPMERSEYVQLDLNGTKIKSKAEISKWFDVLQNAGIEKVAFSWFGNEATHDCFVNRKGYFAYLNLCAAEAKQRNISIVSKIFLHKEIMGEIDRLITHLEGFSSTIICAFMEYSGNAKKMEEEFLTYDDYNLLSCHVKQYMSSAYLAKFKTEKEWILLAKDGKFPMFSIVDYILYIDSSNIQRILDSTVHEVIQDFRAMNSKLQNSIGDISELAEKNGDKDCLLLYECRDVLRKWMDIYYNKDSLDVSQLFSFTHNCVEWKVYERL